LSCREVETLRRVFLYKFEFSFLNGILMVSLGLKLIFNSTGKWCVSQKVPRPFLNDMTTPTSLTGANMKTLALLLAAACLIIGAMYYALPGGSLPTFMPGYAVDSTRIHMLHGFAAVIGAVVFLLIGLSTTPYHRQPGSPNSV
jgi:hypothetical protein